MYSMLDNDWDIGDVAAVTFRKINFSTDDDVCQMTATIFFRKGWLYLAPTPEEADFNVFSAIYKSNEPELWATMPTNPDRASVHTPLRDMVYYLFNHLFYDVSNFLGPMYPGVGHLHPPNSDVLGLSFPQQQQQQEEEKEKGKEGKDLCVLTQTWETEVVLVPAYLAPGVVVRAETPEEVRKDGEVVGSTSKVRGRFGEENPWEVWYFAKGVETRFYIEGQGVQDGENLAAVLVYGKLCPEDHSADKADSDEDNDSDSDNDSNNDSDNNDDNDDETGDDKTGDDKPGDDKSGDDKPGDDKSGDDKPGDDKSGDDKPGDDKSGDDKPGDDKPGDDKTGDDKTGDADKQRS